MRSIVILYRFTEVIHDSSSVEECKLDRILHNHVPAGIGNAHVNILVLMLGFLTEVRTAVLNIYIYILCSVCIKSTYRDGLTCLCHAYVFIRGAQEFNITHSHTNTHLFVCWCIFFCAVHVFVNLNT